MDTHRALRSKDIIYEVLKQLGTRSWTDDGVPYSEDPEDEIALARCARVCKAFNATAIPLLWKHLASLVPLMRLLSAWRMIRQGEIYPDTVNLIRDTYMLVGETPVAEWDRFRMYASHVSSLAVVFTLANVHPLQAPVTRIGSSTWMYLAHLADGKPILPNLRTLCWEITSPQCTALFTILSPSVEELTVYCGHPDVNFSVFDLSEWEIGTGMLLSSLHRDVPSLRRLSVALRALRATAVLTPFPLARLSCLRSIYLKDGTTAPLRFDSLRAFAGFEMLEELHLDITVDNVNIHTPRLSTFPICSTSPSSTLTEATTLEIFGYPHIDILAFEHSCRVWARCFPTLRHLSCYFLKHHATECRRSTAPEWLLHALRPLFELSLQSLELEYNADQFSLGSGANVLAFDGAWPDLKHLSLLATPFHPADDFATLHELRPEALLSLAEQFPRLETLVLPCMQAAFLDRCLLQRPPPLKHQLRVLDIAHMDVDDYPLCATFLNHLFPYLETHSQWDTRDWSRMMIEVAACQPSVKTR
ncbi:hypothetical protein C8Q80DRAFT_1124173 [Daedaleopsis nitida]|nr:hypothetical protein C8Q80DRAFT_1124173 [Daedaleopsis nitida]